MEVTGFLAVPRSGAVLENVTLNVGGVQMFAPNETGIPALIDAKEAAKRLGLTVQFLAIDRHKSIQSGTPPLIPYVKVGPRLVRYRKADLDAFVMANLVGG